MMHLCLAGYRGEYATLIGGGSALDLTSFRLDALRVRMSRALGLLGLSQLRLKRTLSFDQAGLLNVREGCDAWEGLAIQRNPSLREHQTCFGRVPVDLLQRPE
jgi:hypothetical protein